MSTFNEEENEKMQAFSEDLHCLTRTELNVKYRAEYNSWRNGKQRAKADGHWAPAFDDFVDFLREMGPCPCGHTLDRIDTLNPLYAPGLVRWASKTEQANNRRSTRYIESAGSTLPAADAARSEGVAPNTARQRYYRALTAEEAFDAMLKDAREGRGIDPRKYRPWPRHREDLTRLWEDAYASSGGMRKGNTRYDYLIRRAKKGIDQFDREVIDLARAGTHDDDARIIEAARLLKEYRAMLVRALREKPLWESAVLSFERKQRAQRNEKTALASLNYLGFEDGED